MCSYMTMCSKNLSPKLYAYEKSNLTSILRAIF